MSESSRVPGEQGTPLFSIVTATFNCSQLLVRTIESLRAQTFTGFEWIVVDGASRDGTLDTIRNAGEIVDRWISEPDDGIADAWNKGIALASGVYVLILNAGDTYDPAFLETIAAQSDGRRIVFTHARVVTEEGNSVRVYRAEPHKLGRAMHLPHNWCAVPRQLYGSLGAYRNLQLAMDFDWFHRYFRKYGAAGFVVIDAALGSYYMGGKSDLKYAESFLMNENILRQNGSNPLVAKGIRLWYSFKHSVSRLLSAKSGS
jgi:glycosyltransferase involved in cell wall biosynthesis